MNKTAKAVVFWLVIIVSASLLWQGVKSGPADRKATEISYSQFLSNVADGQVSTVTIAGAEVRGRDVKGSSFRVTAPPDQYRMLEALQQHGVEIWYKDQSAQGWPNWILNLAPLILLAALWFFMIRQMQRSRRSSPVFGPPPSPDSQSNQARFGP